jgi:hypothetical protein
MSRQAPRDLSGLLDELARAARSNGDQVSLGEIREAIGGRSFGPLLTVAGLLALTPVGVIPGAPTALAVMVALIAGQLLIGVKAFWLPKALLRLSVKAERLDKAVEAARKPARVVDRILKPRLAWLTGPIGSRLVATVCILVAAAIPPLEFVPFAVFAPAAAITAFGLGLLARDGAVLCVAFAASALALGLIVTRLL